MMMKAIRFRFWFPVFRPAMQGRLRRLACALCLPAAGLLCGSCAWWGGSSPLPVRVEDRRSAPTPAGATACVDVFAVKGENAVRRALATPADEYFATLGLPSRPVAVWRCRLDDDASARVLEPGDPLFRVWRGEGADMLVAVSSLPRLRHPEGRERRMAAFPLRGCAYPSGTRSLLLMQTDAGLFFAPSPEGITSVSDSTD